MSTPALPRHRLTTRALHGTPHPTPSGRPQPAAAPSAKVAGRYRYDRRSGSWWWSPEMLALQGLDPGAVEPCAEVLLEHQHPDDRARTLAALTATSPFALETRLVREDGSQRSVVLVGEPDVDSDGGVSAVEGLYVDVTDGCVPGSEAERVQALQTEVAQMRAAMASRAAIEQAKGMLMLLTSCNDQVAFDLLAHISSHTHRKVRDVAQAIVDSACGHGRLPEDVRNILRDACPPGGGHPAPA